jgi:hypothetical protein
MSDAKVVSIPPCGTKNGNGGGGGEGWSCFAARLVMTLAAILAIASLALAICLPPAAASVLAWIAAGLGAVAVIAGALWGIFCPKPCAWALLLSWQVSIGVGCLLLCFTTCCPNFWWIGLGLLAAGVALMSVWKSRCHKDACGVLKELAIALSSVVVPLIGWLGMIPVLSACINHAVATALSTLAGIVTAAVVHCGGT